VGPNGYASGSTRAGQVKQAATAASDQVKKAAATAVGKAQTVVTPPSGQAGVASTAGNSAVAHGKTDN